MQVGFAGLLTLLFVAAKLFGAIAWSWLWVLSPLWIGFAIIAGLLLIGGTFVGIASLLGK